ncbi:unnamed protein product [Vitrella brassicaformis CCMP3155]|uniref:Uncharacterized protein n=1 Tax=Vitrella brassicaformis (strain CCMP3155) TaxID=1169540 RepID=A0A0G4H5I6_VITBC|nr:unnamed protein product [Vitrella brassicaformis CCMP3155]|eukprot:CEM39043.1 unnamed protein product [Vitrella brassicaformis CCMP3155]
MGSLRASVRRSISVYSPWSRRHDLSPDHHTSSKDNGNKSTRAPPLLPLHKNQATSVVTSWREEHHEGVPSPTTVRKPWPAVVRVASANRHQFGDSIDTNDNNTTRKPSNDGLRQGNRPTMGCCSHVSGQAPEELGQSALMPIGSS